MLHQQSLSQPLSPALPLYSSSPSLHEIPVLLHLTLGQHWGLRTTHEMAPGFSQASSLLQGYPLLERVEGEILSIPSSVWTTSIVSCELLYKRTFGILRATLPFPPSSPPPDSFEVESPPPKTTCWTVSRCRNIIKSRCFFKCPWKPSA